MKMKIAEIEKCKVSILPKSDLIDGRVSGFVRMDLNPGQFSVVKTVSGGEVHVGVSSWSLNDYRLMVLTEVEVD
jgi:hypothetical protein